MMKSEADTIAVINEKHKCNLLNKMSIKYRGRQLCHILIKNRIQCDITTGFTLTINQTCRGLDYDHVSLNSNIKL